MPIYLNTILREAGLDPAQVRLLRHADRSAEKRRTPYELWRDDEPAFNLYQSIQSFEARSTLSSVPFWASFGATMTGDTIFLGVYHAQLRGVLDRDLQKPHNQGTDLAGSADEYVVHLTDHLVEFRGLMLVDWGQGMRAWIQRADNQNKRVLELRQQLAEQPFPGYSEFIEPLSRVEALPQGWREALGASRGIYLLTCPRTREQYVGQAGGERGFLGRWLEYASNLHGGNEGLKGREASDYQVSILEVAGSAVGQHELNHMEARWKAKLQSREMGLNRN